MVARYWEIRDAFAYDSGSFDGQTGTFPSSFVKIVGRVFFPSTYPAQNSSRVKPFVGEFVVEALYDFEGSFIKCLDENFNL